MTTAGEYLTQHGWTRQEGGPEINGLCGVAGATTGECYRSANWEPPPYHSVERAMCWQHARARTQAAELAGQWR